MTSATPRPEAEPLTDWFASIYRQSESTISMILDMVRKNGEDVADFVVVVADLGDEATRFFVDQLGDGPLETSLPGFVGAVPKATVARVLRVMGAHAFADDAEKPLESGRMRLLVAAGGRVQCADIAASPPMTRGGSA